MNEQNPDIDKPIDQSKDSFEQFLRKAILSGWALLIVSTIFLYLSSDITSVSNENYIWSAIFMMISRTCGIASFLIGALALFNERWTTGVLLFVLSLLLPVLAFHFHGTI